MSEALLHGQRVQLVPVGHEHYDYLRHVEMMQMGPFWRLRGGLQSPEEFAASIWSNVLVQLLGVGTSDGKPLVWLRCDRGSAAANHAAISVARLEQGLISLRAASAVAAFIEYLFTNFEFRKLYLEVPEVNLEQFESVAGHVAMEEGRLRDHLRHGDRYIDLVIMSLWADHWYGSPLRESLLDRL